MRMACSFQRVPSRRAAKSPPAAGRQPKRLAFEPLEARQLMAGDMVLDWNDIIGSTIRADATQPGPTYASRNYAIVHAAIYDAVNSIDRTHTPFLVDAVAPSYASREAAVAAAAHDTLVGLYPLQTATLDVAYQASLAEIPDGLAEDAGVAIGQLTAARCLADRAGDHAFDPSSYTTSDAPGHWRPAAPLATVGALGANWGGVTPFVLDSGDQFLPGPPPDMTSDEYTFAFNEARSLGELNSTTRTAEQTEIGIFWGYDRGGLGPPPILYNHIAQTIAIEQGNTLSENARLFALLNLAQADAGIVAWDAKYVYDFWRPITAIREADTDGNPNTVADPDWEPLGAPGGGEVPDFTPPFPAYSSGHATFGASVFRTLANFFGTDKYEFTVASDELPGVTRSFSAFSQAAAENARSRIYLGIHWFFDDELGQATGVQVADFVFQNALLPIEPAAQLVAIGADAGGGPRVRVFDVVHNSLVREFLGYNSSFGGGVRVAMGDVNLDGAADIITAPGPGGGPHIKVFSGVDGALLQQFMAYGAGFLGGVHVAAGDVNGDGRADIITGADAGGGPHVRVFSGLDGADLDSFMAFDPSFGGGVRVAAADVNGDNLTDIITAAGAGGGPHVRAFSGQNHAMLHDFFAYGAAFTGGVYVAAGDVDGDGNADIVTGAGAGGGPHVRAFSGADGSVINEFMAYGAGFQGGIRVAVIDHTNDRRADIISAPGPGGGTQVVAFEGFSGQPLVRFVAFTGFQSGVFVAGVAPADVAALLGPGGHHIGGDALILPAYDSAWRSTPLLQLLPDGDASDGWLAWQPIDPDNEERLLQLTDDSSNVLGLSGGDLARGIAKARLTLSLRGLPAPDDVDALFALL